MNAAYYTYIHTRADDKQVFYVGKGTARDKRAESAKGRSAFWKRTVAKHGIIVDKAMWFAHEADAFEHERFLIQCFRQLNAPLANLTDGGEGCSGMKHSEKTRKLLSDVQKGRKRTPEQVAATSEGNRGQKRTAEQRAKFSAAQTGRVCLDSTREKLRLVNLGKVRSAESNAKRAEALRGRKKSPEHIQNALNARVAKGSYRRGPEAALKAWATKRAKANDVA